MNKKTARYFTQKEMWRIIDLAKRRMIDNGLGAYDQSDQKLFRKMRDWKDE